MQHDQIARELGRVKAFVGLPDPAACRAIRKRARVSQRTLANSIGCTQSALSRWEAGQQLPRGDTLLAYVMALEALAAAVEQRERIS